MELYTTSQIAKIIGVTKRTIDRWRSKGIFIPEVKTPGGHSRYTKKQLDELLKNNLYEEIMK